MCLSIISCMCQHFLYGKILTPRYFRLGDDDLASCCSRILQLYRGRNSALMGINTYANLLRLKFIEVIEYGILLEFHLTDSCSTVGAEDIGRSWPVTIRSDAEESLSNLPWLAIEPRHIKTNTVRH